MVFTLCGVVLISQTRRWHLCTANVLTAMCKGAALIESSRLNIMMMLIILLKLGGRYVGETPLQEKLEGDWKVGMTKIH